MYRRNMKNLFIIPNMEKEASLPVAERLLRVSREAGGRSVLFIPSEESGYPGINDIPEDTEAIVVLGGDGTVIRAASHFFSLGLPILGVNTGRLGFLCGFDAGDPDKLLKKIMEEDFCEEERLLLHFSVIRGGEMIREDFAFNEVTVRSSDFSKTLALSLCVNEKPALEFAADGIILSSPTGSTAYNLSAGGPLVYPSADVILATPLNTHSFLQRSVVLPAGARIAVRLSGKRAERAGVYYDGCCCPDLQTGDEVLVTAAERKVRLLNLRDTDFFDTLRKKIGI